MRIVLVVFFSCLSIFYIDAQRFSEKEIGFEAIFIEANQKKLLGKYDAAIELYQKLIEEYPVKGVIYHDLARVYLASDNPSEALKNATKAVRYEPDNVWYKLTLAEIQEINKEYVAAAKTLGQLAEKEADPNLYDRWAAALSSAGKYPEAVEVLNKADLKLGKEEYRSDTKIELMLKSDNTKGAIAELNVWIDRYPDDSYYLTKLGKFYTFIGSKKKAIKAFNAALKIDANDGEALVAMKQLEGKKNGENDLSNVLNNPNLTQDQKVQALMPTLLLGDPAAVNNLLPITTQLAESNANHAQSQAIHADVLFLLGDIDESMLYYKKTLALDKSNYQVWDKMMSIHDAKRDVANLKGLANEALDYFPNQSGAYYYLAKAHAMENEFSEASEMIDEATFIAGNNTAMLEKLTILNANIKEAKGDTQGAIAILESLENPAVGAVEMIGDLYLKVGEKEKAVQAFTRALGLGGDKTRLKLKLDSI